MIGTQIFFPSTGTYLIIQRSGNVPPFGKILEQAVPYLTTQSMMGML